MKHRPARHLRAFLAAVVLVAFLLTSCSSTKGVPDARVNTELQAPGVDSTSKMQRVDARPSKLPSTPSLFNRATDALRISTPAGRAARQQRKDARAAVPRSIGKGAVYAPNNTGKILSAGNKGGAVANADSGAVLSQVGIGKNKGPVAAGPGASATQTIEKPGFWSTVASGLSWWWLLIPAGYAVYRFRKSIPFIG
jgi:hypothetical protein